MKAPLAVYVHFPWCVAKCPYCDFNSHPLRGTLEDEAYTEALLANLAEHAEVLADRPIATVFFGGGTPSLFAPRHFQRLLQAMAPYLMPAAEITMEANPGTAEYHDFGGYRDAGINRLSFGAQSFDAEQLRTLGRIHSPEETRRAVSAARAAGFENLNLDLMYGLPGQTIEGALSDLEAALALAPEHLSWYQLTIEPRTEFAQRPPLLPEDDALADMEDAGLARLAAARFARYEVSAFARTAPDGADYRCRHNLNYWTFGDYLGLGAGAHGKVTGGGQVIRTERPRQPRLYLNRPAEIHRRPLDPSDLPGEFMLNALRLTDGVPLSLFSDRTGQPLDRLEPARSRLIELGMLRADRLQATPRGYRLLNSVIQAFL